MVPLGKYALMPGTVYNTNKVLASLGDNWFVQVSEHAAQEIIERRQTCEFCVVDHLLVRERER